MIGKPNQKIKPSPLQPITSIGEPFGRVIIDCVGPLPKSKTGNKYLLTIMCVSTRFPEAVPLRKITAPVIVNALTKFFTVFGMPKEIQTDLGSNFTSGIFSAGYASVADQTCHIISISSTIAGSIRKIPPNPKNNDESILFQQSK